MEADLARYKCAMNMVDGALERSDVKVFKHTKTYRVLHTANKSWGSKLPVSSGTARLKNMPALRARSENKP